MKAKKILSLIIVVIMVMSLAACGGGTTSGGSQSAAPSEQPQATASQQAQDAPAQQSQEAPAQQTQEAPASDAGSSGDEADGKVQADGMLWAVEPLPEKTKLVVAYVSNSSPQLTTYVPQVKGWLEAVNLEVEMVYFANGPAQMEACSAGAWDVASTGIGGVITGILGHDIKILGVAARDEGLFQAFFARKDSDIVADGAGHAENPNIIGKPETWMGKKILTAIGTTNHYTLYNTLLSLGLTLDDVNAVNMDVASASTAFKAGEGDVVGVWGSLLYDEAFSKEDSDYVLVSSDQWLGCGLVTNYVAAPAAWDSKQQAIEKWLEMCLMGGEWCKENLDEAAELYSEFNEADGYDTPVDTAYKIISENPFATLEDNYGYYTQKSEDGQRLIAQQQIYNPMVGYVDMGNYTQDQLEALFAGDNFVGSAVTSIYERVN